MASSTDYEEIFHDGDIIVSESDDSREMYVIQSGAVVVVRNIDGVDVELARLERGNFFGEMSLLESISRSATIRAVGKTKLLVIKPGSLLLKIRRNPTFAFEMLQQMSHRIRRLNAKLTEFLSRDTISEEDSRQLQSIQDTLVYELGPTTESRS
ncbi:MAG: cyclic nucleotide-binding domain-containing protein [Pirellulales bacterium]